VLRLLLAWFAVKHEEFCRHLRWGRSPGRTTHLPWSTRKKFVGCLWMLVLVTAGFMASLFLGGLVCWLAEEYGWVGEEGEKTLSTVVACVLGAVIIMTWIGVYLMVDSGRLPWTRDFWQKVDQGKDKGN
jgi:hypothetical protein